MERAATTVGDGKSTSLSSSAPLIQLLVCASRLIESTPPEIISSANVSLPVDSIEQAYELANFVTQFAAEHAVLASVEFGEARLRVSFSLLPAESRAVNGG